LARSDDFLARSDWLHQACLHLVLEESALAEPFVTHNEDLLAVMLPGLEAARTESLTSRSVSDAVRTVLGRRMCGERPSVDKVAHELRMSVGFIVRSTGAWPRAQVR
jgi:hypothetical protein